MTVQKKKIKTIFFIRFLLIIAVTFFSFSDSLAAEQTVTQTTQSDFEAGNVDAKLDSKYSPGNIELKENKHTLTQSTKSELASGLHGSDFISPYGIATQGDGEIVLNHGYSYNNLTNPKIESIFIWSLDFDYNSNLVYLATYDNGVYILSTKGTRKTTDDEMIAHYNTSSTPALPSNRVYFVKFDSNQNLLYLASNAGLIVIDTFGNSDSADDVIFKIYNTTSIPAIASNAVRGVRIDEINDQLFIGTASGLTVIDRKTTKTHLDDTSYTYRTTGVYNTTGGNPGTLISAVPKIPLNETYDVYPDNNANKIYIATWGGGISVLNTKAADPAPPTPTNPVDDSVHFVYSTTSSPAINNNNIEKFTYDESNELLYAACQSGAFGALVVINIQNNKTFAYKTTGVYETTSGASGVLLSANPKLSSNSVKHVSLDSNNDLLYVSAYNTSYGITVIDRNGTLDMSDDTFLKRYSASFDPALYQSTSFHSILTSTTNQLFFVSGAYVNPVAAVNVINVDGKYNQNGTYRSNIFRISNTPTKKLFWEETLNENQSLNFQYRIGESDAAWIDDFDDGNTSNIESGSYGFSTIAENNGIIKLSDPKNSSYSYFSIIASSSPNYFSAGSMLRVKYRVSSSKEVYTSISQDVFEGETREQYNMGEWDTLYINPDTDFSKITLFFNPTVGDWMPGDFVELDFAQIELADANWSSWSTPCANKYGCPISGTSGKEYLQYRANFESNDENTTPSINSITLSEGYQDQGTFTSSVVDSGGFADWKNISADLNLPAGTTAEVKVRSGNTASPDGSWSSWQTAQ